MEVTLGFVDAAAAVEVDSHRREGALRWISEVGQRRLGREDFRNDLAQQRAVDVQDRDIIVRPGGISQC